MVVAAGPAEDGRLDQGVRIPGELGPEQAALVVEADEAALELRRRVGVRGALDLGRPARGPASASSAPTPGRGRRRSRAWPPRPAERTHRGSGVRRTGRPTSAGRSFTFDADIDQGAGPGAADMALGDQPVAHGQRPVAAPGLRAIELGDIAQHGTLVLGDDALVPPDALRQLGRAGITAVVPAEGSGPAGRRGAAGTSRAGTRGRRLPCGRTVRGATTCAAPYGSRGTSRGVAAGSDTLAMSMTTRKPT